MKTIFDWLLGKAKDYLLRNWKTTVLGIVGAALSRYISDPAAREAILAAVIAGIGLLAKDGDRSGTTAQPRLDPARVEELAKSTSPMTAPPKVVAYPDRQAEPYDPSRL